MRIQLSVEQEAQFSRLADQTGRSTEELAREAVDRYLAKEGRILSAVRTGRFAAARGEFVETSAVWARVERALNA